MATATYTCTFSTESYFNSHPTASLSGPSSTIPDGATVSNVSFKVYCGVSEYNYDADTCMTITDGDGSSISIEDTCNTGSSNRIWAEFGGAPYGDAMDWNNLSSIMLYGTTRLATRTGYTATLTITYEGGSSSGGDGVLTAPTSVWVEPSSVGAGKTATLYWEGAEVPSGDTPTYAIYRGTSRTNCTTKLASVSGSSTSYTVTAPSTPEATYYYRIGVTGRWTEADEVVSTACGSLTAYGYGKCTAPTDIELSAESAAPGEKVQLSWSGADEGEHNPITGYEIYRADSVGGEYTLLTTVGSTSDSAYTTVTAPTTNGATYVYKILTVGTESGYNSTMSTAYAVLTCAFETVGAPTTLSLNVTNVAPSAEATLSWSGATAPEVNPITGYEVYRSTESGGTYELLTTVETTATSGSAVVTAPADNGTTYYYKIKTLGTLDDGDSVLSTTYTALTCTYSAPNAPTMVAANGANPAYVLPGGTVTLAWSGASAGANNPITGYSVYRDGEEYLANLEPTTTSADVPAHDTAGNAYAYTVVALGTYSNSAKSAACTVYAYTDPTAPTEVTVSSTEAQAGLRVTLAWSGAEAGAFNDIVGYRVYRADTANGEGTLVASVTASSCYVDVPNKAGATYYYRVETVGSYSSSGQSTAYASVTAADSSGDGSGDVTVIVPAKKPRKKRGLLIGDYDTATEGPWTLTGWSFAEPEIQATYLEIPGRADGPLDLSTALTGGDPRYNSRELTATFECSEGTRLERREMILDMVGRLHGRRLDIVLPDDSAHYITGRVGLLTEYNDMAHAAVTLTAICEPWRYARTETWVEILADNIVREAVLTNNGRRLLIPELTVTGYNARVLLVCGGLTWELTTGVHMLPDLVLPRGNTVLTYSGSGTVTIKYREAWL